MPRWTRGRSARQSGESNRHHTTKQKGRSRRGTGIGTYSRLGKSKHADRYDRPYLTGNYRRDDA